MLLPRSLIVKGAEMQFGMSMRPAELLLTLTGNASKCESHLTGLKGAAFLRHLRRALQGCRRNFISQS